MNTNKQWTAEDVLSVARAFQPACVLVAGAELGVFDILSEQSMTAKDLARRLDTDVRATTMLVDALAAMEFLTKDENQYAPAAGIVELLTEAGSKSILAMVRHLANCLRNWAELAKVTESGRPAEHADSIRGPQGDLMAFIEAMDEISRPMAPSLLKVIGPPVFSHLLDLGGGPGTWTIAMLQAVPDAKATLFDLPDVIPIARRHIAAAGLENRVTFAPGDFEVDETLPCGADLAWVSAIVHMNSRQENRDLFAKIHTALADGGRILIRDVIMEESHTSPPDGAMFAINMLVNTPGGGTYTFSELSEDLITSGFHNPKLLCRGEFMDSVIEAIKA